MRGTDTKQGTMLSLVTPEQRVPQNHPLRAVKRLADAALVELSPTFSAMYSAVGRPSIPPERLLKSSLLMALYTVRSERLFCEQLDYNLLFRWFLDMDMREFVAECRERNVTPHGAQCIARNRGSMIDGRTTCPPGYAISQRVRKRVEEV